jgi:hypothetical protein
MNRIFTTWPFSWLGAKGSDASLRADSTLLSGRVSRAQATPMRFALAC